MRASGTNQPLTVGRNVWPAGIRCTCLSAGIMTICVRQLVKTGVELAIKTSSIAVRNDPRIFMFIGFVPGLRLILFLEVSLDQPRPKSQNSQPGGNNCGHG